jgi:hypothetical protein
MKFEVYQIIVPIISIAAIALTYREFKKGNNSLFELFMWGSFWGFIALVAIFPDPITHFISQTIGIKDHINAIIFIGLAMSFFLHFRLFNTMKKQNAAITELVRQIAINNELKAKDS